MDRANIHLKSNRFICQTFQPVFFGDDFEDVFKFLDQNPCGANIGWAFWAKHYQRQKKVGFS